MIRVDIETTIHRPVEAVFDRLVDIDRYPLWMPKGGLLISCRKDSPGPTGPGTRYSDKTRLGTVHGEVTVFEPPHAVIFHYQARVLGIAMMDGWPAYALERADAASTRISHHAEGRLHGPFKLLQPLIAQLARRERRRTVAALKRSLEPDSG